MSGAILGNLVLRDYLAFSNFEFLPNKSTTHREQDPTSKTETRPEQGDCHEDGGGGNGGNGWQTCWENKNGYTWEYMTRITRAEYAAVHVWLTSKWTKEKCEAKECDGTSVRFEWALKHNKLHSKVRSHYLVLCRKCHVAYDKKYKREGLVEKDERMSLKLPKGYLGGQVPPYGQ